MRSVGAALAQGSPSGARLLVRVAAGIYRERLLAASPVTVEAWPAVRASALALHLSWCMLAIAAGCLCAQKGFPAPPLALGGAWPGVDSAPAGPHRLRGDRPAVKQLTRVWFCSAVHKTRSTWSAGAAQA